MIRAVTVLAGAATFIIFVLVLFIHFRQKYSHLFATIRKIPGPPGYPIIGNVLEYFVAQDKLFQVFRELNKKYSPIYMNYVGNEVGVHLTHPADIELILSSMKHINKPFCYDFLKPWLCTGLLTNSDAKWQKRRKILTPAFHFNILRGFVNIFIKHTEQFVKCIAAKCDSGPIDILPEISDHTLCMIAESSMGVQLNDPSQSATYSLKERYKQAIHAFGKIVAHRIIRPWLHYQLSFDVTQLGRVAKESVQILHSFSQRIIKEKKKQRKQHFSDGPELANGKMAMLDLLLKAKENGEDIDDDGIREEVDTFMFEGHDTTAICLLFTLSLLASHPEIQEQVYQEIVEVLGDVPNPTLKDLKQLEYMERCIKESLRLFPSVPLVARLVGEDVVSHTGYTIPKGATAFVHIFDLHRNPDIYPDPERFNPDRFLPDMTVKRHPYAFIPFSAGPRNCIGQKFAMFELKATLCGVVRNFILEPVDKLEDLKFWPDLVLRSQSNIRVKFRRRQ